MKQNVCLALAKLVHVMLIDGVSSSRTSGEQVVRRTVKEALNARLNFEISRPSR